MTEEELMAALAAHAKWRAVEPGGKRAVLAVANLRGAGQVCAALTDADLTGAIGYRKRLISFQCERWPVTIDLDDGVMQIGCNRHSLSDWWAFTDEQIRDMDQNVLEWWGHWKPALQAVIAASKDAWGRKS